MNQLDYQADFNYDDTEWQDDILTVLNEQTISENLDSETYELLKSF
jgi:hypothetical protein